MATNYNTDNSYPKQKISRSKKDKKWGKACVDWILTSAAQNTYTDHIKIKANYDLYNNIIDKDDFKYVTDPYGLGEDSPGKLHNYNIITPKINLLSGEEIKRPFNFRAAAVNSEAVSQLQGKRKDLLLQYCQAELANELMQTGVNLEDPAVADAMTPPEIEKYMNYSESDIRESTANKIIKYIIKKENLEYKFNKGFKDALISDREIYYIGIDGDEPICETVNPLDFDFDKDPDLDFIQDGQWARHTKYMTPNQILDIYHEDLTEEEVSYIDGNGFYGTSANISNLDANNPGTVTNYHSEFGNTYIAVTKVEWKSMRKIGFLKYYDEFYEEQEIVVDETYEIDEEAGEEIEWVWISEVWEGTKIGNDIYTRIRPKRVQYRTIDNPSICKLGYVGAIFNGRNSKSTSLIDLVKHHQYIYNIVMYRMEMELAKAKGKKLVMDLAQIPRSQGMTLEKWMHYFDNIGIAFINSFEEGKGPLGQGRASSFNQFQAVDMSLSQSIGQYIGILNKIEEQVETLMGVSRQRQGAISSNETVGGVERAVVQSSHITEPIFYIHNEVKKYVLTHLLETAKVVYPEGKKIGFILDDVGRVMLEIGEEFSEADYGIFVTNSAHENRALDNLRSIAEQAAASGLMTLTDLITVIDSNSMADIKATVEQSEIKRQQEAEAERNAAMEQIEAQKQADLENMHAEADRADNREIIKGEIQKEIAYIRTFGGINASPTDDTNNNNVPDVLEFQKLYQQRIEHRDKMNLERDKLKSQEKIASEKAKADKAKANKSKTTK